MSKKKSRPSPGAAEKPQVQPPLSTPGDSAWAAYQRNTRITSTTLIRVTEGLIDPEEIALDSQTHLLDIFDHEAEAARVWHRRRRLADGGWIEGAVRLRYQEQELMPAAGVWDVVSLWFSLLQLIEEFQQEGRALVYFPDEPVPIALETVKRRVFFTVDETRVMVEPLPFLRSLVDEAERFFQWVARNVGADAADREIETIRSRLAQT